MSRHSVSANKAPPGASHNSPQHSLRSSSSVQKKTTRRGIAMATADIKDYMNEAQKSAIFMREAKALIDTSELIEATECIDEAISLTPHQVVCYIARATCHKNLHMFTEAYYDYSFLIKLEAGNGAHYCNRALCLAKLKRLPVALQDLDMAVELDPISLHYYSRAVIYAESCQYERAMKDFQRAIQEERDLSDFKIRCLHRRACMYYEMKKYNAAMKDLMSILMVDPTNCQTRSMLGKVLKMMSQLTKAETQINYAIKLEPDQGMHFAERGDIRYQLNDASKLRESIADYDQAISLMESQNTKLMKTITLRIQSQMKVGRRRRLANSAKMTDRDRADKGDEDKESSQDDASVASSVLNPDGSVMADGGESAGGQDSLQKRPDTALDPIARSLLQQAQIKDFLYRKLHGELLPGDKAHERRFLAAQAAGTVGHGLVPSRALALLGSAGLINSPGGTGLPLPTIEEGQVGTGTVDGNASGAGVASQLPNTGRSTLRISIPSVDEDGMPSAEGSMAGYRPGDHGRLDSRDGGRRSTVCYDEASSLVSLATGPATGTGPRVQSAPNFQHLVEAAMNETYEQLADVLFRRAQAKLLAGGYEFGETRESELLGRSPGDGSSHGTEGDPVGALTLAIVADRESDKLIQGALADAIRASYLVPADEEYRLLIASCEIRLGHFESATDVLADALQRSPNNEMARYLSSYSLRAAGKLKDAVAELTHIIEVAHVVNKDREVDLYKSNFLVPPERVLETRGILRRLLQAHEEALQDLEQAVRIDDHDPRIFFLIGDSKSILGDYDQAVLFFNTAQEKGYVNPYMLVMARGMVLRLLDRSAEAMEDFLHAIDHFPKAQANDDLGLEQIRLHTLRAMCVLDVKDYPTAKKMFADALKRVDACKEKLYPPSAVGNAGGAGDGGGAEGAEGAIHTPRSRDDGRQTNELENYFPSLLSPASPDDDSPLKFASTSVDPSVDPSLIFPPTLQVGIDARTLEVISDAKQALLFRLEWIICYHLALALYHMKKYSKVVKMLNRCLSGRVGHQVDGGGKGLRMYAPSEVEIGACLFYKGIALSQLNRLPEALRALTDATQTQWVHPPHVPKRRLIHEPTQARLLHDFRRHQMLCAFARAKLHQRFKQHEQAVATFAEALEFSASSSSSPQQKRDDEAFIYFRRGWSCKALNDYIKAGDDFETAKRLQPHDPNFALAYAHIGDLEYMEFASEPDVTEPFPQLILLPASLS